MWRVERDEGSNWTTPFVWEHERRTEIVTAGTGGVGPTTRRQLLWELKGMSMIAMPSPLTANGMLFVESGYPGDTLRPVYAIRPGASGDISLKEGETSNAFIAWADRTLGTFHPSPLVYRGCLYILHDRGFLTCSDAATGKPLFGRQRISTDTATFTASPWAYNGKVFALSEDGDTYVIQAGPEFKVLGRNSLNEMSLATPAVARGSLILRTASKLYGSAGRTDAHEIDRSQCSDRYCRGGRRACRSCARRPKSRCTSASPESIVTRCSTSSPSTILRCTRRPGQW